MQHMNVIFMTATRTIMNAVNKQNIARSETTGHVTSVAMPTRKIASARTHVRMHAARTCKAARIRTRK